MRFNDCDTVRLSHGTYTTAAVLPHSTVIGLSPHRIQERGDGVYVTKRAELPQVKRETGISTGGIPWR